MLTLSNFIAILGMLLTAFGLGYKLGRDKRNDVDKTQK